MTEANEETIVINDLLSFISCKIKLYPKEKLINCLKDFYSSNAVTEAETTLVASLPNHISHDLKIQSEKNIFKRLYNSFLAIPEDELPIFVCKNLNNVPKLDEDDGQDEEDDEEEDSEDLISEQKFIKAQIAEISSVVYQLKDQIQLLAAQRSKSKPSEEISARKRKLPSNRVKTKQIASKKQKNSPDHKTHKGLAYLQTLIDQEEEEKVKRLSNKQESKDDIFSDIEDNDEQDENEESFAEEEEEEDYDDNTLQLIANRRQRALVKNVEAEVLNGNKVSSTIKRIQSTQHITDKKKDHTYDMMKKKMNPKATDERVNNDKKSCDYDEDYEEAFGFEDDDEDHDEDDEDVKIDMKRSGSCDKSHIKVEEAFDGNVGTFSIYKCTLCNFSTNDEAAIERHDCPQIYCGSEEEEATNIFKYFCFECKFRGNNQAHFKKHLIKHPQSFSCPICPEKIEDPEEWSDHVHDCIDHENLPPDNYICNVCNVIYASPNAVRVHKSNHDPNKQYECLICKFRFPTSEKLDNHFKLHQSKGYKCPFCFYVHKNRYTFFTHLRSHTGDTPFACSFCDYRSTSLTAVNAHTLTHSTTKDVECDKCPSRFKSKQKLKIHQKVHQKLNVHKCPECDKSFKSDWLLTVHHSNVHINTPAFPCPMCEFTANSTEALKAHINSHDNDKVQIFTCSLCSFRTNYKTQLDDHLKKSHLGLN